MELNELCILLRLNSSGIYRPAAEAADAIERMAAWLEGDCYCPCCTEQRTCLDDCTLHDDDPNAEERLAGARGALFGA